MKLRLNDSRDFLKQMGVDLWVGGKFFFKRQGMLLAAGSTFYFILSSFPFILSLVALLSFFLRNFAQAEAFIDQFMALAFPNIAGVIKIWLTKLMVQQKGAWTWSNFLNFVLLMWAGSGFISSFFSALTILDAQRFQVNLRTRIKAFWVMTVMMASLVFLFTFTPLSLFFIKLLENFDLLDQLFALIPNEQLAQKLSRLIDIRGWLVILVKSNVIHFILILFYFTGLFKMLLGPATSIRQAFTGSIVFVIAFMFSKFIFWIYLETVRDGLVGKFGDAYTLVVSIMWVYFVMIDFFFCLSVILNSASKKKGSP